MVHTSRVLYEQRTFQTLGQVGEKGAKAEVERDAALLTLRVPIERGRRQLGGERARERGLARIDVAQDANVHIQHARRVELLGGGRHGERESIDEIGLGERPCRSNLSRKFCHQPCAAMKAMARYGIINGAEPCRPVISGERGRNIRNSRPQSDPPRPAFYSTLVLRTSNHGCLARRLETPL